MIRSEATPSRLGLRDAFCGACRRPLQVPPSASFVRCRGGVVGVELESSLPGDATENVDVCVSHVAAPRDGGSASRLRWPQAVRRGGPRA